MSETKGQPVVDSNSSQSQPMMGVDDLQAKSDESPDLLALAQSKEEENKTKLNDTAEWWRQVQDKIDIAKHEMEETFSARMSENKTENETKLRDLENELSKRMEEKIEKVDKKVSACLGELFGYKTETETKLRDLEDKLRRMDEKIDTVKTSLGDDITEIRKQIAHVHLLMWICIFMLVIPYLPVGFLLGQFQNLFEPRLVSDVKETRPMTPEEPWKLFDKQLSTMRLQFPSQTKRLWNIMGAATETIFTEDEPTHPAVILLVGPRGNRSVIDCLAQRYAQAVTETFQHFKDTQQPAIFDCEVEVHGDPSDTKRRLDQVFTGAFKTGSRAGIVLHLESLAGQAAMIFYRFCDNDNAPFKKVVIILTLNLESDDAGNEKDNVAYNELRRVWKSSLDSDKIEPMLSRIGNSVAFIRPETRRVLKDAGCFV